MKTKKMNKKLALNKKTISHLDNLAMKNSKGGAVKPRTMIECWLYATDEWNTCDCTYYCGSVGNPECPYNPPTYFATCTC